MARLSTTSAWTAVLAMSLSVGCSDQDNPQTASGSGVGGASGSSTGPGSSSSTASSTSSTAGPSAVASSGAGAGGSGGAPFVCDPAAEPGSIYERSGQSLNIEEVDPISMCKYRGDVMLVINTAAV